MGYPGKQMSLDRRRLLDRLEEISIQNFPGDRDGRDDVHEIIDTPTSGTTALPTPPRAGTLSLPRQPVRVTEPSALGLGYHPGVDSHAQQSPLSLQAMQMPLPLLATSATTMCPNAPLIKDLDSFTDDTGKGSFDSISAAEYDEQARPLPQITASMLENLSSQHDPRLDIQSWREDVSSKTPPTTDPDVTPTFASADERLFSVDVDVDVEDDESPSQIPPPTTATTASPLAHHSKRPRSYTSSSSDDSALSVEVSRRKVPEKRTRVKSLSAASEKSVFVDPRIWQSRIEYTWPMEGRVGGVCVMRPG